MLGRAVASRTRASAANTTGLWILVAFAALWFLRAARELLIPIALAVLVSYALEPIVAWLERHQVPRFVAAGLVMLIVLGTATWGSVALRHDAVQVVEALPAAAHRAREVVLSRLGFDAEAIQQTVGDSDTAPSSGSDAVGSTETSGQAQATSASRGPFGAGALIQRAVHSIIAVAGQLVVIVFLTFFLLISGHHVRNRLIEITGPDAERRRVTSTIIGEISAQVQRYLLVLLVTAIIVGVVTWLVLSWIGVEHAAVWGLLAGVFNSISYFGPLIVSGGLLIVGLAQGGGMAQALQMSAAAIVITSLEGWLLTPALMGKAERMSALAVFLGLLLWTWLWGPWGTVLAVPMLAIIKSIADHTERFRSVGRLMAP